MSVVVGLIGLGIGLYTSVSILSMNEWNPTVLLKFPETNPEQMAYGRELLGEIVPSPGKGHDGKHYFIQAMDPFYMEPDRHARLLDRPSYRAQRMLYPTLAGGFGLFPPTVTAWSLLGLNLIAVAVGGWVTARLAFEMGLSPWFGLAFVLNPGVVISSIIDTAEVLAMVFFLLGGLFLMRRRYSPAGIMLALAALTRETMLLAALGAIAWAWRSEKRMPPILALPFVVSAAWWFYLRLRIGYLDDGIQDLSSIGVPFRGLFEAIEVWMSSAGTMDDMLLGVVLLVLSLLVAWRAWVKPDVLAYMTAGFSLVAITITVEVWGAFFDSSRALIPVATVYVLMVMARPRAMGISEAVMTVEPARSAANEESLRLSVRAEDAARPR